MVIETPEYIKKQGIFSKVFVSLPESFDVFLKDKKMKIVYSESVSDFETGNIKYKCKIYQTQQEFFLYLSFQDDETTDMTIYYKEQQSSELTIFIKQLLKQFKNATINNK